MKVDIFKIIRITAGGMHCLCESNVGVIRKQNHMVPQSFWNMFNGLEIVEIGSFEPRQRWYQRLWNFILKLLRIK